MRCITRIWRRCVYLAVAAFIAVSFGGVLRPAKAEAIAGSAMVSLTNSQRVAVGLAPLNINAELDASAYAKAMDMLAKNYWAHNSPAGATPWTFISAADYPYVTAGENLAQGYTTDSAVMSAWMASPEHKANILNPAFKDVGIAVVSGTLLGQTTTLVVAHYGATSYAPAPVTPKPVTQPVSRPATVPAAQPAPSTPSTAANNLSAAKQTAASNNAPSQAPPESVKAEAIKLGFWQRVAALWQSFQSHLMALPVLKIYTS